MCYERKTVGLHKTMHILSIASLLSEAPTGDPIRGTGNCASVTIDSKNPGMITVVDGRAWQEYVLVMIRSEVILWYGGAAVESAGTAWLPLITYF